MAVKETAASYKLDFKYTFKEGRFKDKHYTIRDFARNNRYYETYSNFDYDFFSIAAMKMNENDRNINYEIVNSCDEMKELNVAFDKWLKRRQPILNAWNDYLEYQHGGNPNYYNKDRYVPPIGTVPNLNQIAAMVNSNCYRRMLETSRPYALPVGSLLQITDKYLNNWRYDPYYWGEHRDKPRVGTVVKYLDDTTGKGGLKSRLIEVMFFADGSSKRIAERALEAYSPTQANKEE